MKRFFQHRAVLSGIQTSMIMGVGDLMAQTLVEKVPATSIDLKRTIQYGSVGLFFVGPALHAWYGYLDRIIPKDRNATKRGLKKVACDQILFSPFFTAACIVVISLAHELPIEEIKKRLSINYFSIMKTNYMLWPAAQTVNFIMVPVKYQVVFAQIIAVVWNMYLSNKLASQI